MGFKVVDGMSFHFATIAGMAAVQSLTNLTNGAPPVASLAAHTFLAGDELLLDSPWEGITDSVVRVVAPAAGTFSLGGLDTSNTNFFAPDGGDTTKVRKITTWKEIPQVETYDPQGGDPVFKSKKLIKRKNATTYPTGGFEPVRVNLKCVWDKALFDDVMAASRAGLPVAYRQTEPDGSASYGYGYLIFKETSENDDGTLMRSGVFSALGLTTSY